MNLYIFPNIISERYIVRVKESIDRLEKKGYQCFLDKKDVSALGLDDSYCIKTIEQCDLIVTLGGDGTFLRGSQLALEYDKPICGINCGHLGYLCTFSYHDVDEYNFEDLKTEEYSLLEYDDNNKKVYALNDIVIGKDYFGGAIVLGILVNGEKLYNFLGDGLIIASPLGSTAYNYSAGGIQLPLDSNKLAITPICPHTKDIKAVEVDDDSLITVELLKPVYKASVYNDGVLIDGFNKAVIKKSDKRLKKLIK